MYLQTKIVKCGELCVDGVLRHFVKCDKVPLTTGHSKSSILQNKGNKSVLLKGCNLHCGTKAGPLAKKNGCISIASLS